jgi:hypothetical protein
LLLDRAAGRGWRAELAKEVAAVAARDPGARSSGWALKCWHKSRPCANAMASALFYDEGNIMNVQRLVASIIALALAPPDAMAKSYKWNCVYTQRASPQGLVDDRFNLEFAFDDFTRKAAIIGNQRMADVEVHVGQQAVTFMEEL